MKRSLSPAFSAKSPRQKAWATQKYRPGRSLYAPKSIDVSSRKLVELKKSKQKNVCKVKPLIRISKSSGVTKRVKLSNGNLPRPVKKLCNKTSQSNKNPSRLSGVKRKLHSGQDKITKKARSVPRPKVSYRRGFIPDEEWLWQLLALYRTTKISHGGLLERKEYVALAEDAIEVMRDEKNVVNQTVPKDGAINLIGDTHGQMDDVITIMQAVGMPSHTNRFLFNGDIVDRGPKQVQLLTFALALKVAYPQYVVLARGNHETKAMNENTSKGFKLMCKKHLDLEMWEHFLDVFEQMPIVGHINKVVITMHGGLPKNAESLKIKEIAEMDKFAMNDEESYLYQLMWNDSSSKKGFTPNTRGDGIYCFGRDVTKKFLKNNNLRLLVRSHEVKEEGFELAHKEELVTLFSAPGYCSHQNTAAILRLPGKLLQDRGSDLWNDLKQFAFQFTTRKEMEDHDGLLLKQFREKISSADRVMGVRR